MTETVFFIVEIEGRDGGPNVASPTLSPAVFERVRHWVSTQKLAVSRESVPPDVQSISVRCGVKDVRLPYLLHMIRSEGWTPWPYYPLEGDKPIHRRFHVNTCRSYSDKELSEFPYLWPQIWGKRWMTERVTDEWLAGRKVCRAAAVSSGWKQRNGLAGGWNFVVHDEVRARHILGKGTLGEIPRWLDPSRIANQITGKGHHPTSTLVENMKRMFGFKCSNQFTPHHIVPGGYTSDAFPAMKLAVDRAKAVLERYHIDINDGANGTYLRNRMGKDLDADVYGPLHNGPPSLPYVQEVARRLQIVQNLGANRVRRELQEIAADIVANKLPL